MTNSCAARSNARSANNLLALFVTPHIECAVKVLGIGLVAFTDAKDTMRVKRVAGCLFGQSVSLFVGTLARLMVESQWRSEQAKGHTRLSCDGCHRNVRHFDAQLHVCSEWKWPGSKITFMYLAASC